MLQFAPFVSELQSEKYPILDEGRSKAEKNPLSKLSLFLMDVDITDSDIKTASEMHAAPQMSKIAISCY